MQQRRIFSGVDKLIMAAMINDAQAAATCHLAPGAMAAATGGGGAGGIVPSGRGIGYLNNNNSTYNINNSSTNFTQIPTPSSRSECELYRLLERANLLSYFGTFLNFGGDDVQQLCDADEEEFIEIMSLVGMTQKPLHVRRLQKALIEWRESRDLEISSMFRYSAVATVQQQHPQQQLPHQMNYQPIQNATNNQSATVPLTTSSTTTTITDAPTISLPQTPQHQQQQHQHHLLPATPKSASKCPLVTPSITSSGPALTLTSGSIYQLRDESPQPKQQLQTKRVPSRESDHQYITPRDLLVGAPKRIRLLDSLNNRNHQQIVESKQIVESSRKPESETCISMKIANSQDTSLSPKRSFEDLSDEEDRDNCSGDEDDIKVMDSSESDGTAC